MKDNCQTFDAQKIKSNEYENFKSFTNKPNFHLVNFY